MGKSKNKRRIDWGNQLVNLIVVILGISIAFYLNNWQAKANQNKQEQILLKSLVEDLRIDINSLQTSTDTTRYFIKFLKSSTKKIVTEKKLESDNLSHLINCLNVEVPFLPSNNTYLSLIASGNINTISDFDLRKDIVELYGQYYSYIKLIDDSNHRQLSDLNRPFLLKELRYLNSGSPNPEILENPLIVNLSYASLYMLQRKFELDSITMSKADALLTTVQQHIKK